MITPQSLVPQAVTTARKELFLLAARALADRRAQQPGDRLAALVGSLAADDTWMPAFIGWARRQPAHRRLARQVLVRADDPGDLLAFLVNRYGRALPKTIKQVAADAAEHLYDEYALAALDTPQAAMRFAEVIALTHPTPRGKVQDDVFQYAAQRLKREHPVPESLPVLRARAHLHAVPVGRRLRMLDRPDAAAMFVLAAMGCEDVGIWLGGELNDKAWTAVLPSMSYRQRLTRLRNLDLAGLTVEMADWLAADLADEASVRRGHALPLEILSAHRAVPGTRWAWALEQALEHALARVPALGGVRSCLSTAAPRWPGRWGG